MDTAALLRNPPRLHVDSTGELTSWRVSDALLAALDAVLHDGARTLETGAGLSTIFFALRGCHHTAVTPDAGQAERITAWCARNDVGADRLTFVLEPSEDALPGLPADPLDVVLIDGAHGFPAPFIDWHYAGRRLRVGGTLIIDDTQIWTGKVLRNFLAAERQWQLIGGASHDFAVVRRVSTGPVGEWSEQPYVLHRSDAPESTSRLRRAVSATKVAERRGRAALDLVRRRDYRTLGTKLRRT